LDVEGRPRDEYDEKSWGDDSSADLGKGEDNGSKRGDCADEGEGKADGRIEKPSAKNTTTNRSLSQHREVFKRKLG
jgi:hypothetical protein